MSMKVLLDETSIIDLGGVDNVEVNRAAVLVEPRHGPTIKVGAGSELVRRALAGTILTWAGGERLPECVRTPNASCTLLNYIRRQVREKEQEGEGKLRDFADKEVEMSTMVNLGEGFVIDADEVRAIQVDEGRVLVDLGFNTVAVADDQPDELAPHVAGTLNNIIRHGRCPDSVVPTKGDETLVEFVQRRKREEEQEGDDPADLTKRIKVEVDTSQLDEAIEKLERVRELRNELQTSDHTPPPGTAEWMEGLKHLDGVDG